MESRALNNPSWGNRLVGMEGLRAVAAIGVLVGHVHLHTAASVTWGYALPVFILLINGLTLFFGLSGFLLFRPFATAILSGERFPPLKRYAINRGLRIYPAYLVILILVSLALGTAYVHPQSMNSTDGLDAVGYLTNPALLAVDATMLQTLFPFSIKTGLGVAWSLTVELIFYVVMPALAVLAMRLRGRGSRRAAIAAGLTPVVIIFLIGIVGKIVKIAVFDGLDPDASFFHEWGGNWYAVLARSFPVHADLFAAGMLAAVLMAAFETKLIDPARVPVARVGTVAVAVLSLVFWYFAPMEFRDTAFAITFGALIFFVALPNRQGAPGVAARTLELSPIRYVGAVSYSFYLWHLPVLWLVVRLGWNGGHDLPGFFQTLAITFVLTLIFSSATYYLVERPALQLKKRTDGRRKSPVKSSVSS